MSNHELRREIVGNLGQKLMKAARLLNQQAILEVQRRGHPFREAHNRLLPHLSFDGIRLTELADRAGITKQSAQRLVDEMVDEGYLAKENDSNDKRAQRIVYTEKGKRSVFDGLDVLKKLELEIADEVGPQTLQDLSTSLTSVIVALEKMTSAPSNERDGS